MILLALYFHGRLQARNNEDAYKDAKFSVLNCRQRIYLAKGLLGSMSTKVVKMVEILKGEPMESFNATLKEVVDQSGLWLKKLDKKI